ncbi:MAG: CPBP family intramembrane metalloprotease, partial [Lachnospiraceae bacterium]|nr:CPBP family intramembrane metalloprotease [Lachnospiraceae bacterium]
MKMNIWKTVGLRLEKEELQKWSSLKKTAYLLLPLFVYFAVHDIAEVLLYFLLNVLFTAGGEGIVSFIRRYEYTMSGIVYGAASLIGVAAILPVVKGEIAVSAKRQADGKKVTAYCFLAAFALCIAAGINFLFCGVGFSGSSETYNEVHKMQYGVQFAAGLILYGIISPLAEEAVFRGILYNRMKRCFHYKIALVVSSLLFGIYHGNLVQAVYGSILGLLIAYFYEQYKSFAAPVLFHAAANISMFAMTYQDRLADIGRNRAMIAGTGFIVAAAGIFFYMKRCI